MRPLRVIAPALVLAVLVVAAPASALPPGFNATPVFSGLVNPTSVRFAPDGTVFVAQKRGTVQAFDGPNDTTPTQVVDVTTETYDYWDRGLLGMAVDPGYPTRPYLYLTYTRDAPPGGTPPVWNDQCPNPPGATVNGCIASGRLVRLTLNANHQEVASNTLIDGWCQQFPSHSIGDLRFVGGQLYASAGDGASFNYADYGQTGGNPCNDPPDAGGALRAQTSATGDGSLLRVNPDTGAFIRVAYGMRNPFRISNRPGTSELWIGDVGWSTWEEVDRFDPAGATPTNYGWPCYEGNGVQPGYDALNKPLCETLYAQGTGAWVKPHWTYNHRSAVDACSSGGSSVSGLAFYPSGGFPDSYDGGLFVSDYSRDCIWFMRQGANGLPDPTTVTTFASGGFHPVELELGPDDALYAPDLTGGRVMRITYNKPTAVAAATPTEGLPPLPVQFDGSASTGAGLSYAWDLDDDGQYDDSTAVSPTMTYESGLHTVRLRVTDVNGVVAVSAPITISVGHRPTATIAAPTAATTWVANQTVTFTGSGSDVEDTTIPASGMTWSLDLHHCSTGCHVHHLQDFSGVASGSFPAPDHEYPSYLTLSLTVTDSDGLTGTTSVRLDPRTVQLTVDTDPAGLQVGLDDLAGPAPVTKTVIEGSSNSVAAPSPQNGLAFSGWSDGGAGANRTIVATASTRLVARFAAPPAPPVPPAPGGLPVIVRPPIVARTITRVLRLGYGRTVRKDGTLRWRVYCREDVSCPATLLLRTRGPHRQTLARRSLRLKPNSAPTVTLRLRRSARAMLRRRGSVSAAIVFDARPAQRPHRLTTTILRLRAPAAWRRR